MLLLHLLSQFLLEKHFFTELARFLPLKKSVSSTGEKKFIVIVFSSAFRSQNEMFVNRLRNDYYKKMHS